MYKRLFITRLNEVETQKRTRLTELYRLLQNEELNLNKK